MFASLCNTGLPDVVLADNRQHVSAMQIWPMIFECSDYTSNLHAVVCWVTSLKLHAVAANCAAFNDIALANIPR